MQDTAKYQPGCGFEVSLSVRKGIWLSFGKRELGGISLCHRVTWGQLFNLFTKPHFQHLETEMQIVALSRGCREVSMR